MTSQFAPTQSDGPCVKTAHYAGRAACRSNRSVGLLAAVLGLITNQCSCLCVSRRSSVKTVGRSELRLEANSTYCTRKFVSENKCTFVSNWSRTILPRHIDHRLVTVRFLSVYVHCQFFVAHFPVAIFSVV